MTPRMQRGFGVLLVIAMMSSVTDLSTGLSALAQAAMTCCQTVSECPAHQPHPAQTARHRVAVDANVPPCCAIAPETPAPAAPAVSPVAAQVMADAPSLMATILPPAPRVVVPARGRPPRPPATPSYLRFSVLLV